MADIEGLQRKFEKELASGTVSLVLLAVLGRASEPLYGYPIAKALEQPGGGAGRQAERAVPGAGQPGRCRPAGQPHRAIGGRAATALLPHQ